jgi:GDP-4-dehydro-6-deoxy-D-mannose reductase
MRDGTAIVTGATGFVGRHLIDRLTASGTRIVAWHRPGGHPVVDSAHASWQGVDVTDREAVTRAIDEARPDRVYHLAGVTNVATSAANVNDHLRTNVLGTHHVLDAVRRSGGPCRILVVSSALIYRANAEAIREDAPLGTSNPYGLSKLAQDHLAQRAAADEGLDVVVARPFNHIGPRQAAGVAISSFARQIARIEQGLAPPDLLVGNLDARRDITDVRDVVAAYERLMADGRTGAAYNVCSGTTWRIRDLLDKLVAMSSTAITARTDPARLRPDDVPSVQGDPTRIRSELGWMPHIPIEQTLRDVLEWWRAETQAGG